jgi:hypothetical protein
MSQIKEGWNNFKQDLASAGFQTVLSRKFKYEKYQPEQLIAAHPDKILITANSFSSPGSIDHVNCSHVYLTAQVRDTQLNPIFRDSLIHFSRINPAQELDCFELDLRTTTDYTGLFENIKFLSETLNLVSWKNPKRQIWVVDYTEEKRLSPESDSGDLTDPYNFRWHQFVTLAPEWVRDFVLR